MKNYLKLFIFIIIALIIAVAIKVATKDEVIETKTDVEWNESEMNFSRVSFFNTQKHKASLAIPDFWEGRYRVKDEGSTVVFLNIDDPQEPQELFRIKSVDVASFGAEDFKEWQELSRLNDTQFMYKLSTGKNGIDEKVNNFSKMLIEVKYILKSFSVK